MYLLELGFCYSVTKLCLTICDPMGCSTPDFPVLYYLWNLLKLVYIIMLSNHLILCCTLLLLPSFFFPQHQSLLQCVGSPHQQLKHWSLIFSISPSNAYSELISFGIDWFDFLAVQETLKSLLQHYNSKASIIWCSAFFMVHLSHPNLTTRKAIALTKQILVCKVMSLLFICYLGCHSFPSYEQMYFNFKAAVTVCSDFYSPRK